MDLLKKKEREAYEQHKAELIGRAEEEEVLITGSAIVEGFATEMAAIRQGDRQFGHQPFLVKHIVPIEVSARCTSRPIAL